MKIFNPLGAVIRAAKRIQINLQLKRTNHFRETEDIMPQVWNVDSVAFNSHVVYMMLMEGQPARISCPLLAWFALHTLYLSGTSLIWTP